MKKKLKKTKKKKAKGRTGEVFTSYSWTCDKLTAAQMRGLIDGVRPTRKTKDHCIEYTYRWRGYRITACVLPEWSVIPTLPGLLMLVYSLYNDKPTRRGRQLMRRLRQTRLAVTVYLEPERDKQGRLQQFFGRLLPLLHPVTFHAYSLYDSQFRLLIGPDGTSPDPDARVE